MGTVQVLALVVGWVAADAGVPVQRVERTHTAMGTKFNVALYARDDGAANAAVDRAFAEIDRLERSMSDWLDDSDLSRLNRTAGRPVPVSGDLYRVLRASREHAERTGGMFDASVGPAVRLWRRAGRTGRLPTPARLSQARGLIGSDHWTLAPTGPDAGTATLHQKGVRLDLGGIAKGYAADVALQVLRDAGFPVALVDAGGDVRVGRPPPGKDGWIVAVQPDAAGKPAVRLRLADAAVATSGSLYRFVAIDGVRYSHIVDPATAVGLTNPGQVTVVAPCGTAADALASAASVALGRSGSLEDLPGWLHELPPGTYVWLQRPEADRWLPAPPPGRPVGDGLRSGTAPAGPARQ